MIKNIGVDRETLVIATKIHTANDKDINSIANTNRKHIKESLDHSLKKLQLEYVDIIYAHMFDGVTSVEEICRAFH